MSLTSEKIRKLNDVVGGVRREKRQDEERREERDGVRDAIAKLPDLQRTEFWCEPCGIDVFELGRKMTVAFDVGTVAHYKAFCPKGHAVRRRITHKTGDPFYRRSRAIRQAVRKMEIDLLQPSDPRFKIYYPEQWARLNASQPQAIGKRR